ncbi:MAG TPA: GNAT family N-acetyltransferase [Allosphingosinicella sp.]|nr:GNAT family N-acetyltransferase [Allosphingosinicella sp.]
MLAPRALRAIARVERARIDLHPAAIDDALACYRRAARDLRLAPEEDVRRMAAKNPGILRIGRDPAGAAALFAYLPLNEFGAGMFVSGRADGRRPDPAWIARPGERPAAFYKWLFHGPDLYIRSLAAIGEIFRSEAGGGCPVFTRGATSLSERLHLKLGYLRAASLYPGAPEWLLALLPRGVPSFAHAPDAAIEIRQVRSFEDLSHVVAIRAATYLAEQFPTHKEEFDGNDFCATHFVGYVGGDPAGAVRIRYFGDFVKLERLAVKVEHRRSKLAFRLVRAAFDHIGRKGFTRVYGHASDAMAPFWRLHGGRHVPGRAPFTFANVEYREMVCDLEPDPLAIRFGVPPMMTVRPEGLWDEPGSLDWSNLADDPRRAELLHAWARLPKPRPRHPGRDEAPQRGARRTAFPPAPPRGASRPGESA